MYPVGESSCRAHDASGPPAIDWALAHPERVERLVCVDTVAAPEVPRRSGGRRRGDSLHARGQRSVARPVSQMVGNWHLRRMYWWQVGRLIRDADINVSSSCTPI